MTAPEVGLLLASTQPPGELVATARQAERAGLRELWIGEDPGYHGGIAGAAALLAATDLPVGLGVAPLPLRHPATLAAELASLAGLFPGRLMAGAGAGIPELLDELGLRVRSPLGVMRDGIGALRTLLAGEELTADAETFAARSVRLAHPPAVPPPLYLGVSGPKALRLSGRVADGTVLSVLSGPEYVRWARDRLTEGGAGSDHRVVVFALCAFDDDQRLAVDALRELTALYLLTGPRNPLTEAQGIADEAEALAARGLEAGAAELPEDWLRLLNVCGTPHECASQLQALGEAGADLVALCFPGVGTDDAIDRLARDVLPLLPTIDTRSPSG